MMDNLPVIVKKGRTQLEVLAREGSKQRRLCPHGKLLAFIDSQEIVRILDIFNTGIHCTIDSHRFTSCIWLNKTTSSLDQGHMTPSDATESYLLTVTSSRDVYIYQVELIPALFESEEGGSEKTALLPFKKLSSMSRRQSANMLNKAQLGKGIESLIPLGSSEGGDIVLLANNIAILCLSLHPSSHQLNVSTVFSIEPNMEGFEDELLPQYVGRITVAIVIWPLLFSLTEDGIVLVYSISSAKCICAINPFEYCKLFYTQHSDPENLMQLISSSIFTNLNVTPDLMKLAVSTDSNHILVVNITDYFQSFPGHYSKNHTLKSQNPSPHFKGVSQVNKIAEEEEEDYTIYGGLSKRERGLDVAFVGPYAGSYATRKYYSKLKRKIRGMDPQADKGVDFTGCMAMQSRSGLSKTQREERRWFDPYNKQFNLNGEEQSHDMCYVTSFKKASISLRTPSVDVSIHSTLSDHIPGFVHTSPGHSYYPHSCILPSPDSLVTSLDSHVIQSSTLLHLDYNNSMIVVYYNNQNRNVSETVDSRMSLKSLDLEWSVSHVAVYKIPEQSYFVVQLPRPNWLILPTKPDKPVYLVSEKSLSLAAFTLTQEDFVAKVLMYGSAGIAEEVCHMNRWDQCSLPLNALETALELRQLDTVSFFLRNRDSSQPSGTRGRSDSIIPQAPLPPPPLPPDQLDAAVELLTNSIKRNHNSKHNCQFAGQLLVMTMNFLLRLIKTHSQYGDENSESLGIGPSIELSLSSSFEATGDKDTNGDQYHRILSENSDVNSIGGTSYHKTPVSPSNITSYIQNLRQYIPKMSHMMSHDEDEEDMKQEMKGKDEIGDWIEEKIREESHKQSWEEQSTKEVIRSALISRNLPLAHAYLIQKSKDDDEESSPPSYHTSSYDVTLNSLMSVGAGFVMEALAKMNMKQGIMFLSQMGADIKQSLCFIFLHTIQRQLREFLAEELINNGWLSQIETDALDYIHIVESYYPLEEYRKAKATYDLKYKKPSSVSHPRSLSAWIDEDNTHLPIVGNVIELFPEYFGGDHALVWKSVPSIDSTSPTSESQQGLYIQVPMYVVLEWDSVARQRILYEALVLSGMFRDTSRTSHLIHPSEQLIYHITHYDLNTSIQLLDTLVPHEACQLVNSLTTTQCDQYIRDVLLDKLARQGVYQCDKDLPNLLYRLGHVHTLFSYPHPLSQTALSNESSSVVEIFHLNFIHYLIDKKFVGLLYMYLDYYELALDHRSISELKLNSPELPFWVDYLIQCRLTARNPGEPQKIFLTSLSCSQLLRNFNTVTDGIRRGHMLMSLATLMYAPVPIAEALKASNSQQPWYVDQSELKQVLVAYPTLRAAIFPSLSTKLTPAESQDITLYELLKGSVPFDVCRLFKWQKTNSLAAVDDDIERSHELPHFSQPLLSQKYAQTERLTYTYFLHQGQPSFALANFVAAKLANCSNPNKRIDKAISRVYRLGLLDFTNTRLVSSCVAFTEMLSRDSLPLRVDTQIALRLYNYLESKGSDDLGVGRGGTSDIEKNEMKRKIGIQFIQLYQSPENQSLGNTLLRKVEKATQYQLKSAGVTSCTSDAEISWNLVQLFCQCHSLPPSVVYLIDCTIEGQWLPLLCHAQLHAVPAKEVLHVVEKYFSDPVVKEHLQLAISTMDSTQPSLSRTSSDKSVSGRSRVKSKRKYIGGLPSSPVETTRTVKTTLTQRDVRAKFYSKVGLETPSKSEETPPPQTVIVDSTPPIAMDTSVMSSVIEQATHVPITARDLPDDLFSVLFQCQDHTHPWRALLAYSIALQRPLLALLAACYDDSCVLDCMCVWLSATMGCKSIEKIINLLNISKVDDEELRYNSGLQWRRWSVDDLGYLLLAAMLESPCPVSQIPLLFKYFDEKNPLLPFMNFHEAFVVSCDLKESKKLLLDFALQIDKCGRLGYYPALVGDSQWVEEIAITFASHMLVTCPTPFERAQLLKLLIETWFGHGFVCQSLDFSQLHEITSILDKANLSSVPAFKITEHFNPSTITTSCSSSPSLLELYIVRVRIDSDHVLGVLVDIGQFTSAREFAKVAGVPVADVTLKEAECKHQKLAGSSYWQYQPARVNFWQKCHTSFISDGVSSEAAAEFFESVVQSSPSLSPDEKTLLLVLALKWRKDAGLCSPEQEREIEKQIWVSHLRAIIARDQTKTQGSKPSLAELITDPALSPTFYRHPNQGHAPLPLLSTLSVSGMENSAQTFQLHQMIPTDTVPIVIEKGGKTTLNKEESEVFDMVIGRLLNAGWIKQAKELATLFQHESPDLTIVLCCIQLAHGKLSPDHLTEDIMELLANRSPRNLIGPSFLFEESGAKNKISTEIIQMLQQLSERAMHSHKCCLCIISCFKIAVALRKSFNSVIIADPFDILAEILSSLHTDKYTLARSFVDSVNIQPKEVAGFLSECTAASLQSYMGGVEHEYSRVKVYEPHMTTTQFMDLCCICTDHALLGSHLLSMSKSLSGSDKPSEESLLVQVEMLVRAHDCYTLDCSVDGIAEVLKVSREITNVLYQGKHYKLMVRLLTGVGRFHEMGYIIHLLLECDEFESLVHPEVEKMEQLRVALMKYLRKHCRHDHEKMEMVALKFRMYRELAKTREERGKKELRKLKHKVLASHGSDSIQILKRVFADFRDAAKIYAMDDCLANSDYCLSQARLVALQLSLLQSGKQLLNLDAKSVQRFMEEQPFTEALIVADAYRHGLLADWVNPLYTRVVIKGDMRYLSEFTAVYPLNSSIMQDLASKYLLERTKSQDMTNNMKKVLSYCSNLSLKHKLAHQLGLRDVTGLYSSDHTINDGFLADVAKL